MKKFASVQLRRWLPVFVIGAFLLLLASSAMWRYARETARAEEQARGLVTDRLADEQHRMRRYLARHDTSSIREGVAQLGAAVNVLDVQLVDPSLHIVASTHFEARGRLLDAKDGYDVRRVQDAMRSPITVIHRSADVAELVAYQPVEWGAAAGLIRSNQLGVLLVRYDLASHRALVRREAMRSLLTEMVLAVVIVLGLMLMLRYWLAQPLEQLKDAVTRISRGDFSAPVEFSGRGELAELGQAVRQLEAELQQATFERERRLAAAQASERRVRTVLESMSLVGVILDRTGCVTFCNRYLANLVGYTPDEMLGRDWFYEFLPPEVRDSMLRDVFLKSIEDGSIPTNFENLIVTRSGEKRLIRWSNSLLRDDEHAVVGVASIGEDITERNRDEIERQVMQEIAQGVATSGDLDQLLRMMHRALQRVLTAENCFVALHDPLTGLFSFPYFVDEFDKEPPPPVAMPATCTAYVFRHGIPALIPESAFAQLCERGEVALVGSPAPAWMGVPLRTPSRTIGVLVLQDYQRADAYTERDLAFLAAVGSQVALVIERYLADAALRAREAELEAILESSVDGVLAVASDGKVIRANRRFAEMWRVPPALLEARDDERLLKHVLGQLVDPEGFMALVQALYESMDEAHDTLHFLDGRVFDRHSAPILRGGEHVGRVWSFHDITARRQAEESKAALEAQLHHAQKLESVGRLAGGIAHDFNNMLGAILGSVEVALDQVEKGTPLHEDLEEIRKAAHRSADLTRQLLAYARRQTVVPKILDLNETITGLIAMLQRLIGEDISIVWTPAAQLWPVSMDPSQLASVLANLFVNARHAISDVGTIVMETTNCTVDDALVARYADATAGEYVKLTVSDSGCGMDEATLGLVFEPFFTTKGVGEGTGLGLASVYGAVRQNEGFVTVGSVLGKGTTFDLYFPRRYADAPAPRRSGAASVVDDGASERLLVVEDEPSILRLATRVLSARGYEVYSASSPEEALRLAAEGNCNLQLLVTDVVMPGMNGRDLAERLRERCPQLPVLFMSGHPADVIANRGMLAPGVPFIEKPFAVDAFVSKVREVLDSAKSG